MTTAAGEARVVRFDGIRGNVLIDRKTGIAFSPKAQGQALRQSEALRQNRLSGIWEVPTDKVARDARDLLDRLDIDNIGVEVSK